MKLKSEEKIAYKEIGKRIHTRRKELGLSPEEIAKYLGISIQQYYKYERGSNRISAVKLNKIAQYLGVEVTYLLCDFVKAEGLPWHQDPLNDDNVLRLVRNFIKIRNTRTRFAIIELVASIVKLLSKPDYR